MSHKGIRSLIEDVSKSLGNDIQFDYARDSDFNALRDKRYPFISARLLTMVPSFSVDGVHNYTKAYSTTIAFFQLDYAASIQSEYALILDEMDDLLDRFVIKVNTYSYTQCITSDDLIMTFGTQTPFIKETDDILTGWLLPVTFRVSGQFNYCGLGC